MKIVQIDTVNAQTLERFVALVDYRRARQTLKRFVFVVGLGRERDLRAECTVVGKNLADSFLSRALLVDDGGVEERARGE